MAKIDLVLLSGLTASDGSIVESGATLKFDSEFFAASTNIRIRPKMYRSRELFESGYTNIQMFDNMIPLVFELQLTEQQFYGITPQLLYERVRDYLNVLLDGNYFEISIT